jgi:Arylsulfotransferase (ASST)
VRRGNTPRLPSGPRTAGRRVSRRPFSSSAALGLLLAFLVLSAGLAAGCGGPEPAPPPGAVAAPVPGPEETEQPDTADDAAQGKWRKARQPRSAPGEALTGERAAEVKAVPYLQGYRPAEDRPEILVHDAAAVAPGLDLYTSGHAAEAVLMDRDGQVLHRWRQPLRRLWPDLAADPVNARLEYWRRVHLFPNGDLLGIYEGLGIVKLDARSNVLWAHRGGIHHDLQVLPNGEIWVLDRDGKIVPRINPKAGILEDMITVLSPEGRVLRRVSLLKSLERSRQASLLGRAERSGDIFHTNTLEVLDGRFADRHPAFRRGNVLVSLLKLDTVAIVDPDREEVVWALTGSWRRQHQPTFLADGNLLLFDNRGAGPQSSRVLELDPLTGRTVWSYGGTRAADFFSKTLGSCQRLPNGNTLLTESENGRALEVTRDGRVVWEFYNPHRTGADGELVAVLFEMLRLPPDFPFKGSFGGPAGGRR